MRSKIFLLMVAVIGCAGGGTAPKSPSIALSLVGSNQTDTVNTTLLQALVARTLPHELVQFQSLPDSGNLYGAFVESLAIPDATTLIADSTDANGQAAVVVYLGQIAGRARIIVTVPKYGIADTATFTVQAGHLVAITGIPADTTVYSGGKFVLQGTPVDRFGNRRTDPISFHVLSGPATLSADTVTATALGFAYVATTSGSVADTTFISVVPTGRIAVSRSPYIHIFNLDGTDSVSILPNIGGVGNVRWAPDGKSLVYDGMSGCSITAIGNNAPIAVANLSGGAAALQLPTFYYAYYPQYARDGSRIYFTMLNPNGQFWEGDPKTLAIDSLGLAPDQDYAPSPSPDGSQLAYFHATLNVTGVLRVLTLSTSAVTDLGVPANQPVWSPVSNQIAYVAAGTCQGQIHIINSDGSGDRRLSPNTYNSGFDWSPDGAWIVALNSVTGKIDVINVASGQALPLTFTSGFSSPAWLPTTPAPRQDTAPKETGHSRTRTIGHRR